jgi:hypothetical protein
MKKESVDKFSGLIDSLISATDLDGANMIRQKMELLSLSIDDWKASHGFFDNQVTFEEYSKSEIYIDVGHLHFDGQPKLPNPGSGTPPYKLQPLLLLHLLISHRKKYQVYEIITSYIKWIQEDLEPADFKKTQTGVIRCFTNTRFAANVLRSYGLLKFSQKEAYKTWVLSLAGFTVASRMLQSNKWTLEMGIGRTAREIHPFIEFAWGPENTYDEFVSTLAFVCKPNLDIFVTFKPMLSEAYKLLNEYWKKLADSTIKKVDRRKECYDRIHTLEAHPDIERFYQEFSDAINVELFIESLGLARS